MMSQGPPCKFQTLDLVFSNNHKVLLELLSYAGVLDSRSHLDELIKNLQNVSRE